MTFINPSLNQILYLFEHQMHDRHFKEYIITYINSSDPELLLEETEDFGNILSVLCQHAKYNKNPRFENAFIFLMNNLMMRVYTLNRSILNTSLLMNPRQADSILILLLKIHKHKAAIACLTHLKVLAEKFPMIKNNTLNRLFEQDSQDQFKINQFFPITSWHDFKELTFFVILTHFNLDASKELIMRWLLSIANLDKLDLDSLMMSEVLTKIQIQGFFDALVLFCDFNFIKKPELLKLIQGSSNSLSQIDFTLTRKKLNVDFFEAILNFYEELYHNHHLTKDEFLEQILSHPRPGFSPMHQLILQGHYDGLSLFLEYLDNLFQQNIITKEQIREAFLKNNAKGFSCLSQAINSFHEDIPKLFIKHLMKYFNKREVLELLRRGSYNPVYKKYFTPTCAIDKHHHKSTNQMIFALKKSLEDELECPSPYPQEHHFKLFGARSKFYSTSSDDEYRSETPKSPFF